MEYVCSKVCSHWMNNNFPKIENPNRETTNLSQKLKSDSLDSKCGVSTVTYWVILGFLLFNWNKLYYCYRHYLCLNYIMLTVSKTVQLWNRPTNLQIYMKHFWIYLNCIYIIGYTVDLTDEFCFLFCDATTN